MSGPDWKDLARCDAVRTSVVCPCLHAVVERVVKAGQAEFIIQAIEHLEIARSTVEALHDTASSVEERARVVELCVDLARRYREVAVLLPEEGALEGLADTEISIDDARIFVIACAVIDALRRSLSRVSLDEQSEAGS